MTIQTNRFLHQNTMKEETILSPFMKQTLDLIRKIAESPVLTILLQGESGTGKNFLARFIHAHSERFQGPFVEINCASLPEKLIESELFGHEKGSFTDASNRKQGLFEIARGGSIFLDEIGEMSLSTQAKLLQVIESKSFRRIGGLNEMKTNVRVIAATNKNLKTAVEEKKFRADLYYRLQLVPVEIPPLRKRTEDIPTLTHQFIKHFNQVYFKKIKGVVPEAEALLKNYPWPGNIRELKNVIERIAILENEPLVHSSHLPEEIRGETKHPV